jgi:DNA polymerase-3 subunit epsilon
VREIVFDTETTGLDAREDRIIEIGGVELINRFPTGRIFHNHINPQGRTIHAEALAIHGITDAQLAGKPTFGEISAEFLDFIDGAKLVAHNAGFDIAFVNAELARLGHLTVEPARVVDTLMLARRKHPMGPNSLDALCRRYGIDNSRRTKHGALLDSELLAEVYIELVGGKQAALGLEIVMEPAPGKVQVEGVAVVIEARPRPLPPRLTPEELAAHAAMIAEIGEKAIWNRVGPI